MKKATFYIMWPFWLAEILMTLSVHILFETDYYILFTAFFIISYLLFPFLISKKLFINNNRNIEVIMMPSSLSVLQTIIIYGFYLYYQEDATVYLGVLISMSIASSIQIIVGLMTLKFYQKKAAP